MVDVCSVPWLMGLVYGLGNELQVKAFREN
jgi:hypothetical protein